MNKIDWESLENVWGFLFTEDPLAKAFRAIIGNKPTKGISEEVWTLVSAYEKFQELISK